MSHVRGLLKAQTRALHERLDRAMDGVFADVHGYIAFLRGTLAALETASAALVAFGVSSSAEMTERTRRLEGDLASLSARRLVAPPALYVPESVARGYGAAYVIEGSALGGASIAKLVERRLGLPRESRSYVELHGEETAARFQSFVERLERWGAEATGEERAESAFGARAMFGSYGAAFAAAGLSLEGES